jgi:uncharacterized protein
MVVAVRRRGSPSPVQVSLVLVSIGALLLSGCAATQWSPTSRAAADAAPASAPRATTAAGVVMERRPEIVQDLKGAVDTVKSFWTQQFADDGLQFRPVNAVYGYVPGDGTTCGGEANVPRNASYCRPDDRIGFDVQWTASVYDELGDAFVYYLIGHEYAHAIQARRGTQLAHTIEYELQADCYSGAYLGEQIRSGVLQLENGDIEELRAGLRAVADPEGTPWFDPAAHGSAEQRISFFGRGFDRSLDACP